MVTVETSRVTIQRASGPTDDVRLLVEELERELAQHYPPEHRHGLALAALFEPHIRFFTARLGDSPVGCGGVALFSDFAELKRMFVRPVARGGGVADAILARLTAEAQAAGKTILRLETGTQQAAAIRFYQRNGFARRDAFPPYSTMEPHAVATSVFFEKQLAAKP